MSLVEAPPGVVNRVRIEASGPSVGAVSVALYEAARRMAGLNGFEHDPARGQEVYERNLEEPDDSRWAYSGRLILHPVVAEATDLSTEEPNG